MKVLIAFLGFFAVTLSTQNPVKLIVPVGSYSFGPGVNYGGQYRIESQGQDGSVAGQYGYQTQDQHVRVTYLSPGDTKNTSNSKDEVITDGINNENQESTSTDQGSASDTSTTNGTTITTDETNASSTASSNVAASTTTRLTKPQTSQSTDTLINAPVNYIQPVHLRPQLIGIRPTQSEFPSYSRPVTGYQGLQALTGYQRPFYVSGQQFGYHRPQTTLTGGGPIWESSGSYGHARPSTNVVSTVGSSQVSPTQVRIPYTSGRRTIPVFLPIQKRPVIAGQGSTNVRLSSTHTNRGVVGFQTLYSQRSPSATSGYSTQQRPQFYPNYNRVHQPPNVVSNRGYQSTFY